jgi:hypothetical protein
MSAAEDEGAGTSGKRTQAALTAGFRLTAAMPRTGVGRRLIAKNRTVSERREERFRACASPMGVAAR